MSQFLCISPKLFLSPSMSHMKSYLEKLTGKKFRFYHQNEFETVTQIKKRKLKEM